MVDTGPLKEFGTFERQLAANGVKMRQIRYVFLTHHHTDHTGFLQRICDSSGAQLIVHEKAMPFLTKGCNNPGMRYSISWLALAGKISRWFRSEDVSPPYRPSGQEWIVTADDSLLLRSLGIPGSILCLPGHTYDSMGLLLDDGTCFAGDAAMNLRWIPGLGNRPLVAENSEQVLLMWHKLKRKGALRLMVSHGKPFDIQKLCDE